MLVTKNMVHRNAKSFLESLSQVKKEEKHNFLNNYIAQWEKVAGCKMTQNDLWSAIEKNIESRPEINTAKNFYNSEFWFRVCGFLIEFKNIDGRVPMSILLAEPIAKMLENYRKISICVEDNKLLFVQRTVPEQHLDSWKDTDMELLFNNLWEILREVNFSDRDIGLAWALTAYP